jgi:hypothetical protein
MFWRWRPCCRWGRPCGRFRIQSAVVHAQERMHRSGREQSIKYDMDKEMWIITQAPRRQPKGKRS